MAKDQGGNAQPSQEAEADLLRATERERLRALVAADMDVARRLHADDFQLVNPGGRAFSKDEYLSGVACGELHYVLWEPEAIAVRLYGQAAVLRYQSRLHMSFRGSPGAPARYWHTDLYEQRDGQWQVVWSQATTIR